MRHIIPTIACALCVAGFSPRAHAAGTNLISTNVVGGNTGWFSSGVWKTNNGSGIPFGTAVSAPVAGNTYTLIQGSNPALGNNTAATKTRNLYTNGTPSSFWTFPGDSLTLTTNTEIRFKQIATPATIETVNFPGVGGNPGLILNGGMLNIGDPINQPMAGIIQAAPGTQSYLCPGNNDGASVDTARAFTISAKLVGSGTLCIFEAATNTPQSVTSVSNTFSGLWLVKAGRLLGSGAASLGTNSSFVMDPQYVLPVPPFSSTAPVVDVAGPAVLEANYDLNSAGTLTLVNGGKMRLHQNCAFTAVTIEGNSLAAGTHYFSELVVSYPNNFDAAGSGAITVQPYGVLPPLGPVITTQPLPQSLYAGRTAHFSVAANANGAPPLTYQWRKNGTPLTDGGNILGSTTNALTISNVSAGDAANYDVLVSNTAGTVPSASVALALVSPSGEAYEAAVIAANPFAFYQLNELGDPAANNTVALDFAGGFNANYGTAVQNGNPNYNIAGPIAASGFPGFASGNAAAQFANSTPGSRLTLITPWNLNTNTVTLMAWINPAGNPAPSAGLVFCRGGGTVAGLNFSTVPDVTGNMTLSYTWNNEWETYSWYSGLIVPVGQWSFVALVVTPTNATLHVMNTNGLASSTHTYNHVVQSFGAGSTTLIGDDSGGTAANRAFSGIIDSVGVFNTSLSRSQLLSLFSTGSGLANYAPIITSQPTNQVPYAGQKVQLAATAGGSDPLTYQWQAGVGGVYSFLSDGARISGSTTAALTIANVGNPDSLDYVLTVANAFGSITSSVANLSVQPVSAAEHITMDGVLNPAPNDWDTVPGWSDSQPASLSALQKPGSTYEIRPFGGLNTRLRTPQNPTYATFPGDVLTVTGNAIWTNNPGTNGATSEIRFKQPPGTAPPNMGSVPGTVFFKKLVMNGGQLDVGNDGLAVVQGEIDVLTNAPIYNDNGADRGYRIESWLTGGSTSSIEYHGYSQATWQSNYVNNLNIAGTSNTFAGKWNIVIGTLLGTGLNSLGTNDIVIGPNGALETTYDLNNPNGSVFLSGRMYLHQNDTLKSFFVNGIPLPVGTYTFAQLNASYPTNFPAAWTPQTGATGFTAGSGSITVLVTPAPSITQQPVSISKYPTETAVFTVAAQGTPPLAYQWRKNGVNLTDAGNLSGSSTTNLTITNIVAGNGGNYDVIVANALGSATSVVATLTVLPTGPAINLTLDFGGAPIVQAQNFDWNTPTNWSDGNPASISVLSNPGSTYEVVAGARLRSPAGAAASTFPGVLLKIDGDGVFVNNNGATIGEFRFKHSTPGTVSFNKLVMNGGQLDNGDNGLLIVQGEIDILANTPIYADSAAGQDRGYQIDAWLTGNGSIEYHAFDTTFSADLNITGTSNTFSGTWRVVQGALLGSGLNSLGTNSITVDSTGALETLYDLNTANASLVLDGQMFLHQNDTFRNVTVAGTPLAPGTYTFAQLNSTYPVNFPGSWTPLSGSILNTGSGSITVIGNVLPRPTLQFGFSSSHLTLTWPAGFQLIEADNVRGPWTTNAGAISPFTVTPSVPQHFYGLQPQ